MKPLLLIDYDGTVCFDRFWRSIEPDVFAQIQYHLFGTDRHLLQDWMRGKLSSEEINQFLAERINVEYSKLWQVFVEDCQSMYINKATLTKINKLRKKFRTILLTDNMDCFSRFTVPALKLADYFDEILNSADHGSMKDDNDGQLFVAVINERGANIGASWLIDNSWGACNHFQRLGGNIGFVDGEHPINFWLNQLLH